VWKNEQRTELVVAATGGVTSYELNGKPLWELRGMSRITVPNPVGGNGMVYVGSGFVVDRQKPLYAIRPGAAGDISLKEGEIKNSYVAWVQQDAAPYVPSFLVAGKYLYVIKDMANSPVTTLSTALRSTRSVCRDTSRPLPGCAGTNCSFSMNEETPMWCIRDQHSSSWPRIRSKSCVWPHLRWRVTVFWSELLPGCIT